MKTACLFFCCEPKLLKIIIIYSLCAYKHLLHDARTSVFIYIEDESSGYLGTALDGDGHGGLRLRQGHADGHSRSQRLDSRSQSIPRHPQLLPHPCRSTRIYTFSLNLSLKVTTAQLQQRVIHDLPASPELGGTGGLFWLLLASAFSVD